MSDPTLYAHEGDDGAAHAVPPDLLELYEVLEWEDAVAHGEDATARAQYLAQHLEGGR